MTTSIIVLAAVLISGIIIIYVLNLIVNSRIKYKLSENDKPIAVDILKAVLFICGGTFLSEIAFSFQTILSILPSLFPEKGLFLNEVMYFSLFLGIGLIILLIVFWFSAIIYGVISKGKNIFTEASNNNLNAIILFAAVLISLTIAIKVEATSLLDHFIPYPEMPIYN